MEALIGTVVTAVLVGLLKWFFSGEVTTTLQHTQGLPQMDVSTQTQDLKSKLFLPTYLIPLLFFSGCVQLGGKETKVEIIMVEPGDVAELVDETPVRIGVKMPDGSHKIQTKKMAGSVLMPKEVYRTLRSEYVKNHPE